MLHLLRLVSVLYSNNVSLMLSPPERMTLDKQTKKKLKKTLKEKIWKAKLVLVGSVLFTVCLYMYVLN